MENKTFLVNYGIYFTDDDYKSGEMKIHKCSSSAHAQYKLEKYFMRKYSKFKKMVVYKVTEDVFGKFSSIFGGMYN